MCRQSEPQRIIAFYASSFPPNVHDDGAAIMKLVDDVPMRSDFHAEFGVPGAASDQGYNPDDEEDNSLDEQDADNQSSTGLESDSEEAHAAEPAGQGCQAQLELSDASSALASDPATEQSSETGDSQGGGSQQVDANVASVTNFDVVQSSDADSSSDEAAPAQPSVVSTCQTAPSSDEEADSQVAESSQRAQGEIVKPVTQPDTSSRQGFSLMGAFKSFMSAVRTNKKGSTGGTAAVGADDPPQSAATADKLSADTSDVSIPESRTAQSSFGLQSAGEDPSSSSEQFAAMPADSSAAASTEDSADYEAESSASEDSAAGAVVAQTDSDAAVLAESVQESSEEEVNEFEELESELQAEALLQGTRSRTADADAASEPRENDGQVWGQDPSEEVPSSTPEAAVGAEDDSSASDAEDEPAQGTGAGAAVAELHTPQNAPKHAPARLELQQGALDALEAHFARFPAGEGELQAIEMRAQGGTAAALVESLLPQGISNAAAGASLARILRSAYLCALRCTSRHDVSDKQLKIFFASA